MSEGSQGLPENFEETPSRVFNNKIRLLVVGVVMVLALGYLVYAAFPGNTRYYLTVDEFWASNVNQDGRSVRVVGKLVPDSFQRETGTTMANFQVSNKGQILDASYEGVFPDLFFNPHSDIVMEGKYGEEDTFHVDLVIVKCPSKYQAVAQDA